MLRSDFEKIEELLACGRFQEAAALCRIELYRCDPVALTCLGGLHEAGLIAEASIAEAERCFRLATEKDYPAALFHLGQLLKSRGGEGEADGDSGDEYVQRAYRSGFVPMQSVGAEWLQD